MSAQKRCVSHDLLTQAQRDSVLDLLCLPEAQPGFVGLKALLKQSAFCRAPLGKWAPSELAITDTIGHAQPTLLKWGI